VLSAQRLLDLFIVLIFVARLNKYKGEICVLARLKYCYNKNNNNDHNQPISLAVAVCPRAVSDDESRICGARCW